MPKLSVSVQDELWAEAQRALGPRKGASRIVQEALRRVISEQDQALRGEVVVPEERFRQALGRVRENLRVEYQRGYEVGLSMAEEWSWFNWREWLYDNQGDAYYEGLPAEAKQEILDHDNPAFENGLDRAVRDLWEAVKSTLDEPEGSIEIPDSSDLDRSAE
jgi:Arc/MetJ family transcription regulator